jgi:TraG P-loop domain
VTVRHSTTPQVPTYIKYTMRARRKVHDADLGRVIALADPKPARRGGNHDAFPAAKVGRSLQVTSLGMKVHRSMGITGAEQRHFCPDGRCSIGDVQHLGAGLRCNGDGQCGPPVELLGQVNDQPGLAGLYLLVRASSRAELDALTQRVAGLFAGQAGAALVPRLQQEQGLRACLPEARDPLQVLHTLDTDTLSTIYPFVPTSPRTPGGILFGVDEQTHQLLELDLFDHRVCQNANVGIFAPSGGGKTLFTKVLARRYLLLTDTDVIIIDRKHEYRALCECMGGQFLRVAPSSPHRINPFDLPPPDPTGEGSVLLDHIQQVLGLL